MMLLRNPYAVSPFGQVQRELGRMLEEFAGCACSPAARAHGFPAFNAWEDDGRFLIEAEVPGLTLEDLDIQIEGNKLSVRGQRKLADDENVVYHRRERGAGEFTRDVRLPFEVDPEGVEATLKDGVLTIVLPKSGREKTRKIVVKAA